MNWTAIYEFFVNLDSNVIPMIKGSIFTMTVAAAIISWIAKKTPWTWDDPLATLKEDIKGIKNIFIRE
jgi:hypothetical protein